jgi:endonuclease III
MVCGRWAREVIAMPPDPRDIEAVRSRLRAAQGEFVPHRRLPVLDEIIATVLSQHTSDLNSGRAFAQLKERFPAWEQVLKAAPEQVADAIRCGGIADQKARRIQQILTTVEDREHRLDLARLNELDDAAVEEYLTSLPGVGPKTAACVLVFAMGRAAFPVDTHVHRIVTRLGWVPPGTTADSTHRLLGPIIPPSARYDLHVALIARGRTVCAARRPRCADCVLRDLCPHSARAAEPASALPALA